jgi:hypothetical protein
VIGAVIQVNTGTTTGCVISKRHVRYCGRIVSTFILDKWKLAHVGFMVAKVRVEQFFSPEYFGCPLLLSCHRCSMLIRSLRTLRSLSNSQRCWMTKNNALLCRSRMDWHTLGIYSGIMSTWKWTSGYVKGCVLISFVTFALVRRALFLEFSSTDAIIKMAGTGE